MSGLLPPVKQRVRVSARISHALNDAIFEDMARRGALNEPGGKSVAHYTAVAVSSLAQKKPSDVYTTFRHARPSRNAMQEVHLQPRLSEDHVAYLDLMAGYLRTAFHERRVSRRTLLIAAYVYLLGYSPDLRPYSKAT